ncbi:MAG: hypothetical protein AAF870_02800 [Pseudomonadota bacterium]
MAGRYEFTALRLATSRVGFLQRLPASFWIFGLPFLVVLTAGAPLNQAGYVDPFIYAAYANDFSSTAKRFGQFYYSSRIAYIIPESVFQNVFGIEIGYRLLRVVALALASGSAFLIAQRFYSKPAAILVACWMCLIPWLPLQLYWTHYDGFGTAYLLAAMMLLTVPIRYRLAMHFAAGFFWLLAINCQVYLLAIGGVFIVPWVVLNPGRNFAWYAYHAAAVLAGLAFGYLMLAATYASMAPDFDWLGSETLDMTLSLTGGAGKAYFVSIPELIALKSWRAILLPLSLIVVGSLIWRDWVHSRDPDRKNGDAAFAFVLYGLLTLILSLSLHFYFSLGVLFYPYYTIYLMPAVTLLLIVAAGKAMAKERDIALPVFILLALLMATYWLIGDNGLAFVVSQPAVLLTAVSVLTLVPVTLPRFFRTVAVVSIVSLTFLLIPNKLAVLDRAVLNRGKLEWALYESARQFQNWVNEHVATSQEVLMWHPESDADLYLSSVQSMFLYVNSRAVWPGKIDYPAITLEGRERMASTDFVVILALDTADIWKGINALRSQGIAVAPMDWFAYPSRSGWHFDAVLLRVMN